MAWAGAFYLARRVAGWALHVIVFMRNVLIIQDDARWRSAHRSGCGRGIAVQYQISLHLGPPSIIELNANAIASTSQLPLENAPVQQHYHMQPPSAIAFAFEAKPIFWLFLPVYTMDDISVP